MIKPIARVNKNARASVIYGASNLLSRGIGFLFTPIFTRLLLPEEYGVYSLYTSLLGIFTVLVSLEICGSIAYKGMAKFNTGSTDCYSAASLGVGFVLFSSAVLIYLPLSRRIDDLTAQSTPLTLVLLVQVLFNTALGIFLAKARYEGKYRTVALINAVTGLTTPLLSVVLIRLGLGGYGRIFSALAVSGVLAVITAARILRGGRKIYDREIWKFIFKTAIPLLPHYLALSFIAQGDRLIVSGIYGAEVLGKYSVAYSLGLTPSLLSGGLLSALLPWVIRNLEGGRATEVRRVSAHAVWIVCLLSLLFTTVLPEIYALFAPEEYSPALPVCYAVAASVPVSFCTGLTSAVLLGLKSPLLMSATSLGAALVGIAAAYLAQGLFGVCFASVLPVVAYLALLALDSLAMRSFFRKEKIYVNNYLLKLFAVILGAMLAFWLKSVPIARLLLLFALILTSIAEIFRSRKLIMA